MGSRIDFLSYNAECTCNFSGRQWIIQAFDKWLAEPDAPTSYTALLCSLTGVGVGMQMAA